MTRSVSWRVAGALVVAAIVVAVVTPIGLALLADDQSSITFSEYRPDRTISDPLSAVGEIEPAVAADEQGTGVVVIDDAHRNRLDRAAVAPLLRGLDRAGAAVRYHDTGDPREALEGADAYVVIDPGTEFDEADLNVLGNFTDAGGRVVVFAEPNRIRVSRTQLGSTAITRESHVNDLGHAYGLHVDSRYVYDMVRNAGNYKAILATPAGGAELDNVSEVALYTAAPIRAVNTTGTGAVPWLRTGTAATVARSDERGRQTVAARRGNVLMIGDSTLLEPDRFNVADNERVLGHVIDFLARGDGRSYEPWIPEDEENGDTEEGVLPGAGANLTDATPDVTAVPMW